MVGHLLGGAGAVAGLAAIKAIETGILPPTINLETPDPECDLDYVPKVARHGVAVDRVLINGFGFGGQNASALFGKLR
jgi:3-oxoacyl-(acyl-carrier-protein) synthase